MLQFRIQSTPNPLARKYVLSKDIKGSGKVSYQSGDECAHVPMAKALIEIPGVTQVHFFENVLTITQHGGMDWSALDSLVQSVVSNMIDSHDIDFVDYMNEKRKNYLEDNPELQEIDDILDRTIRPGLQMDGGDICLIDLEDNILSVEYLGSCGGCPSSMTGTLQAITHILRTEYREDIEVVVV